MSTDSRIETSPNPVDLLRSKAVYGWRAFRELVNRSGRLSGLVCKIYEAFNWLVSPPVMVAIFEPFFRLQGRRPAGDLLDADIKRIAVLRTDLIGDVVLTTPFFRELRRLYPDARISLLVGPGISNIVELCPYVDEIVVIPFERWSRYWLWHKWVTNFLFAAGKLHSKNFDLAINVRWDTDEAYTAALAYLTGARWRVGYSECMHHAKALENSRYDLLYTHAITAPYRKHEVDHNLHIIRALGGEPHSDSTELWLSYSDHAHAEELLSSIFPDSFLVGFCVSSSLKAKEWPLDRFSKVAEWVVTEYDAKIVVVGGPEDSHKGERLAELAPDSIINCAGLTSLRQCAAVLKRCKLYVGNDSGPMHIASVFGVPVVGLFAHPGDGKKYLATCPHRFSPRSTISRCLQPAKSRGDCANNTFKTCVGNRPHCILQISVESVKDAIRSIVHEANFA